ncbi:MAG: hypothetical protein CL846_02995 [Crocinitomicaceae bacterium]|nr:hypothetical protein [Crocinitomicaceae bacterium]|tara:strand:- start:858 stop:2660 length:1803 start_codon:yes stop_codon:yes gene_type:complete
MKEKSEDLNIQIQYKLIEELTELNKNLQSEIKQNKTQLDENQKHIKNLQIINKFSKVIQESKTIEDITWSIAKNAIAELKYEDCVIYLIDKTGSFLIQSAAHGAKNPKFREILNPIKIKVGDGIVGGVAKSKKAEIVNDTSNDKRYIIDDENRMSEITVPIIFEDKLLGIIDSENKKKNFYSNDDLEMLSTIASLAATKIMESNHHHELLKHQLELENIIEERTKEVENQNLELKKLSLFPKHNPNPVIELDFNFNLTYCNKGAVKYFGNSLLKKNHPDNIKYVELLKKTTEEKNTGVYQIEEGFKFQNQHFDMRIYVDNELKLYRLYFNDISLIKNMQNELKEQNESIYDSLNYAQRIQKLILPDSAKLDRFFSDHLIFYKPKDVVSGDFYWIKEINSNLFLSVCDCTGHGVPGALMSIIGYDALNNTIKYIKANNIGEIMESLNKYFFELQNEKEDSSSTNDSMDLTLISYNKEKNTIRYIGCKHQFYVIRNNEVFTYRTSSHTLGSTLDNLNFKFEEIDVQKDDVIYMFSDGFPDQFGGEKGKKFKYKPFRELLLSVHHLSMDKQYIEIEKALKNWQNGKNEFYDQIDDISIVGLKI